MVHGATAAGAAQLEVFLTGTALTSQCFGESDPARDSDHRLYNGQRPDDPVRWPRPGTVQQQRGPPSLNAF